MAFQGCAHGTCRAVDTCRHDDMSQNHRSRRYLFSEGDKILMIKTLVPHIMQSFKLCTESSRLSTVTI